MEKSQLSGMLYMMSWVSMALNEARVEGTGKTVVLCGRPLKFGGGRRASNLPSTVGSILSNFHSDQLYGY